MNSIKHLWEIPADNVYNNGYQYSTLSDLRISVSNEREEIPLFMFNDQIDSMTMRCAGVLCSQKAKTKN